MKKSSLPYFAQSNQSLKHIGILLLSLAIILNQLNTLNKSHDQLKNSAKKSQLLSLKLNNQLNKSYSVNTLISQLKNNFPSKDIIVSKTLQEINITITTTNYLEDWQWINNQISKISTKIKVITLSPPTQSITLTIQNKII